MWWGEWRCSWSSTDRLCFSYIWVINNVITYLGETYFRGLTVPISSCPYACPSIRLSTESCLFRLFVSLTILVRSIFIHSTLLARPISYTSYQPNSEGASKFEFSLNFDTSWLSTSYADLLALSSYVRISCLFSEVVEVSEVIYVRNLTKESDSIGTCLVAGITRQVTCPLTHLSLDKMAAISQTIFWDAFSWMKNFVFLSKFHWSLFLGVQLTITQHWFR